jgi:hypothetical protein
LPAAGDVRFAAAAVTFFHTFGKTRPFSKVVAPYLLFFSPVDVPMRSQNFFQKKRCGRLHFLQPVRQYWYS